MSQELGQVEKPLVEEFKEGRKLYFVPLIYCVKDSPDDYLDKFNRYWNQVEDQLGTLELKLGKINRIYHELVPAGGDDGVKMVKDFSDKSYQVVKNRLDKGAQMEAAEEDGLLTEMMDWSRCLAIGLQNQGVFNRVYQSYTEVSKKRNEYIAGHIDETLKADEIGMLFMREGHQIQFPRDIQVFYVSPPALDEIGRWLRDREIRLERKAEPDQDKEKEQTQEQGKEQMRDKDA
ncbi:MAG: hypothetical protein PHI12_05850 [Dehalococcoidales bacterium]|nr:hypothetical protein [Dehalococcoidales bacterium]